MFVTVSVIALLAVAVGAAVSAPLARAYGAGWAGLRSAWSPGLISRHLPVRQIARFAAAEPALPVVPVGGGPVFAAQNHRTHTLYVTNSSDGTVSVVNVATCSSLNLSGCTQGSPVLGVGKLPLGLAVDETTNTIYVANAGDGTVSVINGATCNAADSLGCAQKAVSVPVGAFGDAVAVDPVTNMVFVTNQDARPGTVSVIDGNSCNGTHPSGCFNQPFATVRVGGGPSGIAVNPKTDTIYVANTGLDSSLNRMPDGNTLSVIDGATCIASDKDGCASVGTVRVGPAPAAAVVDPATDTVYVANDHDGTPTSGPGTVSVVDGSHCNGTDQSGCASQAPPQVVVGRDPIGVAVDGATHSVYVMNPLDDTVSVINAAICNGRRTSGCKPRPPTIALGGAPSWAVVDSAHHTVYVVDQVDNNVAVLSDQRCNANTSSGCRHPARTAPAGSFPNAAATDERFQTVYIGDVNGFQSPYTISMIDAATCNADARSGCVKPLRALRARDVPISIAVNQHTDTVYVATSGPLQVIAATTCNATTSMGCTRTAAVPAGGGAVAVDPSTNTIYAPNIHQDGSGYVSVIDGRHCNAADTSGCAAQTSTTTPTVAVGHFPAGLAVDPATHTVYVANSGDHTVSVIDTRHCHAGDTTQCATQSPPTVAVSNASGPIAIAVDQATHTAYVTDTASFFSPGALSLIDTAHCRAGDTSTCGSETPRTIAAPAGPGSSIHIDPQTHAVYVANLADSSVSVIDNRHCNATDTSRCSDIPKIEVGSNPSDLTLDDRNHTAYVPNFFDENTSVFSTSRPFRHNSRASAG